MKQTHREIPKYEGLPLTADMSHAVSKRLSRAQRNGGAVGNKFRRRAALTMAYRRKKKTGELTKNQKGKS